jgi:glycosyltransferase involved in cell wall biosynthesis
MKISLVIPAWNAAATLGETLESVQAQGRRPDEVIVVDDGSDDDTAAVAEGAWPGVRIVSQARSGVAAATNRGIAASSGDVLAFLDADDLWTPTKTVRQLEALTVAGEAGAVLGLVEHFMCPSVPADRASRFVVPETPQEGWVFGTLVIGREAFERVGPLAEDLWVGSNIDWFDRARRAGMRFRILPETVLRRRVREGSLAHRSAERDRAYLEMARRALARRRAGSERPG